MISKNHYPQSHVNRGFTLLELIITLVMIGIAGSLVTVGLASLSGLGQEKKTIDDAQLAQGRLELILAEKRHSGFPNATSGFNGTDPCQIYNLDYVQYPSCNDIIAVTFKDSNTNANCLSDNDFEYCSVTVSIQNGQSFQMRLYKYE